MMVVRQSSKEGVDVKMMINKRQDIYTLNKYSDKTISTIVEQTISIPYENVQYL